MGKKRKKKGVSTESQYSKDVRGAAKKGGHYGGDDLTMREELAHEHWERSSDPGNYRGHQREYGPWGDGQGDEYQMSPTKPHDDTKSWKGGVSPSERRRAAARAKLKAARKKVEAKRAKAKSRKDKQSHHPKISKRKRGK